ncbi:hypothetical protein BC829DRAFT_386718 [Chytridium lagenaria]|nr:hypothetical protein BC829DRAFT_386718 [Chytridium lagenaria]
MGCLTPFFSFFFFSNHIIRNMNCHGVYYYIMLNKRFFIYFGFGLKGIVWEMDYWFLDLSLCAILIFVLYSS